MHGWLRGQDGARRAGGGRLALGLAALLVVGAITVAPAVARDPHLHQVGSSLVIPSTGTQASQLAFNLDGDALGTKDNRLGSFLVTLATSVGLDVQAAMDDAVDSGTAVALHAIATSSVVNDRTAAWRVYTGKPTTTPKFDGTGRFRVDTGAPRGTWLHGRFVRHRFTGGPGTVNLQLALGPDQPPISLRLAGARIAATCTARACTKGVVGGGVSMSQIQSVFLPALASVLQHAVTESCGTPSVSCTEPGSTILALFDQSPQDGAVSVTEVESNGIITSLLAPDLDLHRANGKRGKDGVKDSLSVGVGFSAVKATFTEPS